MAKTTKKRCAGCGALDWCPNGLCRPCVSRLVGLGADRRQRALAPPDRISELRGRLERGEELFPVRRRDRA